MLTLLLKLLLLFLQLSLWTWLTVFEERIKNKILRDIILIKVLVFGLVHIGTFLVLVDVVTAKVGLILMEHPIDL